MTYNGYKNHATWTMSSYIQDNAELVSDLAQRIREMQSAGIPLIDIDGEMKDVCYNEFIDADYDLTRGDLISAAIKSFMDDVQWSAITRVIQSLDPFGVEEEIEG
jgi:hypothetical protein